MQRRLCVDTPACLACTAPGLELVAKGVLKCQYCASSFRGLPLICPSCGWINTIQAESCPDCGEPMTVITQVISRQDKSGGPRWLERVQSQAEEIKKSEEIASRDRLQKLQEIDRKREEAIAEEKVRRSKDDRFFLILIGSAVLIVIIIVAILAFAFG
jgi:hypothetical protein